LIVKHLMYYSLKKPFFVLYLVTVFTFCCTKTATLKIAELSGWRSATCQMESKLRVHNNKVS
jgi:hypothetical protein